GDSGQIVGASGRKIVQNSHRMSAGEQVFRQMAADKSCAASDEAVRHSVVLSTTRSNSCSRIRQNSARGCRGRWNSCEFRPGRYSALANNPREYVLNRRRSLELAEPTLPDRSAQVCPSCPRLSILDLHRGSRGGTASAFSPDGKIVRSTDFCGSSSTLRASRG